MSVLVVTSQNVLLPLHDEPVPATIQADPSTGKIIEIEHGHSSQSQWPSDRFEYIDAGELYVLPGLVE
jgi:allantoinase